MKIIKIRFFFMLVPVKIYSELSTYTKKIAISLEFHRNGKTVTVKNLNLVAHLLVPGMFSI